MTAWMASGLFALSQRKHGMFADLIVWIFANDAAKHLVALPATRIA